MQDVTVDAMPLIEKLRLMEALWDSLCRDAGASQAVPDWHEAVLEQRARQLDLGSEAASDWNEARERIRRRTGLG